MHPTTQLGAVSKRELTTDAVYCFVQYFLTERKVINIHMQITKKCMYRPARSWGSNVIQLTEYFFEKFLGHACVFHHVALHLEKREICHLKFSRCRYSKEIFQIFFENLPAFFCKKVQRIQNTVLSNYNGKLTNSLIKNCKQTQFFAVLDRTVSAPFFSGYSFIFSISDDVHKT